MNLLKKLVGLSFVALLVTATVRLGAAASISPASVNIDMPAAQSLNLTVSGDAKVSGAPFVESQGEQLGGLVHNTQETFDAGLAVNGTSLVDSSRNVSSTDLYVAGVPSGNLGKELTSTMSSSASTTACIFSNTSGATRVVLDAGVIDRGSATSLGSVVWTAGTTTGAGNSIGFTKVLNTNVTRVSGSDVLTGTSSAMLTAKTQWNTGEYFSFISATTSNSGRCYVRYSGM